MNPSELQQAFDEVFCYPHRTLTFDEYDSQDSCFIQIVLSDQDPIGEVQLAHRELMEALPVGHDGIVLETKLHPASPAELRPEDAQRPGSMYCCRLWIPNVKFAVLE